MDFFQKYDYWPGNISLNGFTKYLQFSGGGLVLDIINWDCQLLIVEKAIMQLKINIFSLFTFNFTL